MPRKNRLFIQGLPHLVRLRGHNSQPLFLEPADYQYCLTCLDKALQEYDVNLHGYSLNADQVLLLLSAADKQQLGRFMQQLGRSYVPFYNHKYQRRGALWESRYDSCPLESSSYFLLVKKYIEQPRLAAPCRSLAEDPPQRIIPHNEYLNLGPDAEQRRRHYLLFCETPDSPAIVQNIRYALEQNCLLATAGYSRPLEHTLQRRLRPRQSGRPRKRFTNPVVMWSRLENQVKTLLERYCYQEIRLSLLEQGTSVPFSLQHNDCPVTHRSRLHRDGTDSCLQLVSRHRQLQHASRLWYLGAAFRHGEEQPHTLRQYHQLGVEAFGYQGITMVLEQLQLQQTLFRSLGLDNHTELRINTPGTGSEFSDYCARLRQWYQPLRYLLTPQQQRWSEENPIRLLQNHDNDPLLSRLNQQAPCASGFISEHSRQQFRQLCQALQQLGIPYLHDHGLFSANHYNTLVFEWHSNLAEEHSLLSRGGCYDENATRITGHPLAACGFTLMFDNLMQLLAGLQGYDMLSPQADVVILAAQAQTRGPALILGRTLRQHFPQLSIINDCSPFRLPVCRKNALRQGAQVILQAEDDDSLVTVFTRESVHGQRLPVTEVIAQLSRLILSS
ncbi:MULTISPECIES: ATP phosphoribosyltransferase regulatory subunit [Tatumella]|uniref:ATP phosphoribosyltransferase regulatory subunit n=1 Tax=Tatumella punctata TaxID=399969 RepID=A0ABW1VK84_9GAMM|nr:MULTISPECIES: ATP phosphoribosyltransferase regulatory subunit [unclassified Tatumella]MBS0856206.1 ATP phosphoribosyltransferase regulatory subunit [Tatumella sp. JGM16]MBS0894529.1 ATP phosphoribosyltransferase regulatory subunit [Tatumella sp. JGM130]MBS0913185.1 ATP phosphoribosyltransferase regulatory subunit [Tatumella sp. JGM91]